VGRLKFVTPNAARRIEQMDRILRQPKRADLRDDAPWAMPPGLPVLITNNFSADFPRGGFLRLDGSAGSDADHRGATQPAAGVSGPLVIADDVIPAGGDGLGWPMDGCEHPIYDPSGVCVVGGQVGPTNDSFAPTAGGGPVTVTRAAVSELAMGLCGAPSTASFQVEIADTPLILAPGVRGAIWFPDACTIQACAVKASDADTFGIELDGYGSESLAAVESLYDTTLTGWTTAIPAETWVEAEITGTPANATWVVIAVEVSY
jgi:hypothetical protein